MSRGPRVLLAAPLVVALMAPLAATASPVAPATSLARSAAAAVQGKHHHNSYSPHKGPKFNLPTGRFSQKATIQHQLLAAINHAHPGSVIHIGTWSFFSGPYTTALIRAHQRGVTVRLVMALGKSKHDRSYSRLRSALRHGNKGRPKGMHSGVRACSATCRGTHGTMHTKLYLFSHTGKAHDVTMWGSPNLTSAATRIQWNDLFTAVDRHQLFEYADHIFHQLWLDRNAPQPYTVKRFGSIAFATLPYHGTGDWVTKQLRRIKCSGATNLGSGAHGHTKIQVAQAIIRGTIGNRIASHLRALHRAGCSVTVMYTRLGRQASHLLAGIPKEHYVQDTNGDGFFDRYLHMKVLTVRGVIGDDKGATLVMNGSENWADFSRSNDEVIGYFYGPANWLAYHDWIKYLWNHKPVSVPYNPYATGRTVARPTNPYAHLDIAG